MSRDPAAEAWSGLELLALLALLAFSAAVFLTWVSNDTRPPDDHDDFYTLATVGPTLEYAEADGLAEGLSVLWRHFASGELHPQLSQTWLVFVQGTLGPSRFAFRVAQLPFLLLFVLGSYLLTRELGGPRLALLAAACAGHLPITLNYARKWDIQFGTAALTPVALYLLLRAIRTPPGRLPGWWAAFGAAMALRL